MRLPAGEERRELGVAVVRYRGHKDTQGFQHLQGPRDVQNAFHPRADHSHARATCVPMRLGVGVCGGRSPVPAAAGAAGVAPSSCRSEETSMVSCPSRCTPPMPAKRARTPPVFPPRDEGALLLRWQPVPPVAKTSMPAMAHAIMVAATVVPPSCFCARAAARSRRLTLTTCTVGPSLTWAHRCPPPVGEARVQLQPHRSVLGARGGGQPLQQRRLQPNVDLPRSTRRHEAPCSGPSHSMRRQRGQTWPSASAMVAGTAPSARTAASTLAAVSRFVG